jgi:hypothetical protein
MKSMSRAIFVPLLASAFCLMSCATMTKVGQSSMAMVQKTSAATTSKIVELSELSMSKIRPAGVKVVEVREKDLKKLPTGQERALAYENTRKRGFWGFFSGPVDFKEPTLPQPGAEMDGSLLPPKAP